MCSDRGHFLKLTWNWFEIICSDVEKISRQFHADITTDSKDIQILIVQFLLFESTYIICIQMQTEVPISELVYSKNVLLRGMVHQTSRRESGAARLTAGHSWPLTLWGRCVRWTISRNKTVLTLSHDVKNYKLQSTSTRVIDVA